MTVRCHLGTNPVKYNTNILEFYGTKIHIFSLYNINDNLNNCSYSNRDWHAI